jgi:carbamoyl-phosphate synthase small subunit
MAGDSINSDLAIQYAKDFAGLKNMDLAKVVSTSKTYSFNQGTFDIANSTFNKEPSKFKVAVYDYGVKKNILRMLVDRGCELTVFNAQSSLDNLLAMNPDGVFLSNGPGDPEPCDYAIQNIKELLEKNIPIFGICLGHQLLSLASGARTEKMKFGHHGANHPVQDLKSERVMITSQNHGFAVSEKDLPESIEISHRSLFDQSIQGIRIKNKPAYSFQGHPEASPGPHDVSYLFDEFIELMKQ